MIETYTWTKPTIMGREYVLRRGGAEIGSLAFEGAFTCDVRVRVNQNEWTFTRAGVMKPVIHIRRAGDGVEIAQAAMRAGGSCDLAFAGRTYRWKSLRLFAGEFAWLDEKDVVLIRYLASMRCSRIIEVEGELPEELQLLMLLLGGYLLVLHNQEVAAVTATLIASSAFG